MALFPKSPSVLIVMTQGRPELLMQTSPFELNSKDSGDNPEEAVNRDMSVPIGDVADVRTLPAESKISDFFSQRTFR